MTVWNFRMIMQNQLGNFPLFTTQFHFLVHSYDHAKWKYLIFKLSFVVSSISSFWIHLNYLKISSKSWSKYIVSSSSSTLFALLDSISLLSLNASKITLKYLQNFTKIISISCKANNVLLGHIKHNTTQKVWNSWELLFKMCCFRVVINHSLPKVLKYLRLGFLSIYNS